MKEPAFSRHPKNRYPYLSFFKKSFLYITPDSSIVFLFRICHSKRLKFHFMKFHMYTTKSIPLLRGVDQQKELKNIVYLPSCKTVSALFMAEPLFFMSRCILWHDESMIQYRYEHLIYYRVLKSYCFLIKKFLLYAKKPHRVTLKRVAGKPLFAPIIFDSFNFEYFILKSQTIPPPEILPERISEPLQKPCLLAIPRARPFLCGHTPGLRPLTQKF